MEDQEHNNETIAGWLSSKLPIVLGTIALVALVLACIAVWFYYSHFLGNIQTNHTLWGEFGDFFGGTLNPIFGFFGLMALLLTLTIQNRELKISSKELGNSASALNEQSKSLKVQNFERTFFEMVRLLGSIVEDLDLGDKTRGRDCFRVFYLTGLKRAFAAEIKDHSGAIDHSLVCSNSYGRFFEKNQHEVGHYFRTLYRIFKYIDDYSPDEMKSTYSGIVRAQLSSYELSLLFYNSINDVGSKFKPLIEDYCLFENMRLNDLFDLPEHVTLYAETAYGDQDVCEYFG